jgi:hypothetical protein
MFRSIPQSVLATAVDGVLIKASSLGAARDAASIEAYARARAAEVVTQAQEAAAAQEHAAAEHGFAAGYAHAIHGFIEFANGIDVIRVRLCSEILEHVRSVVAEHCSSVDLNAAWIERWCEIYDGASSVEIKLSIPENMLGLFERLKPLASKRVPIELAAVEHITLELGQLVHEFMPDLMIFESGAVNEILGQSRVLDDIRAQASAFANHLKRGKL